MNAVITIFKTKYPSCSGLIEQLIRSFELVFWINYHDLPSEQPDEDELTEADISLQQSWEDVINLLDIRTVTVSAGHTFNLCWTKVKLWIFKRGRRAPRKFSHEKMNG